MDWARIQLDWTRFRHAATLRWERLSEEQLLAIRGRRHLLAARITDAYAITREDAERQLAEWQAELA